MIRSRAYLSALLTFVLLFASASVAIGATQSELEAHRLKAAEARRAAEQAQGAADALRKEVETLDKQIADLQGQVRELAPKIEAATDRTTQLKAEVAELRGRITEKETEIALTEADYELQTSLLSKRMSTSYKQGDLFYLDMLFNAKDLGDLITRTTLVQRVIESDRDIAMHLAATKVALEQRRAELNRNLETVQTKRTEAELVEKNLRDMQAKRQSAMRQQESIQDQKADMMAENEANADRLRKIAEEEERESARIESELRARSSSGSGVYNGVMAWPVPGFYRIASSFGYRIHPIFNTRRMHTGIDIGRSIDPPQSIDGAAIVASGDGTVIFAGSRSGYGNTVMVDHGEGVVTLYAHMQSGGIKVSNGQSVVKGQTIGLVGSTGYSTGPHLHFEVRINGSPVDPMQYLR
jgi:murein DD-endopeptidase MepM/ murein hydrolase activator NlpD